MCRSRTRLGNTPKLSYEEQLCMTLTYFREYRTQYHYPLTEEQKLVNRQLAKVRIIVEHVIRALKIFKMLAFRYRNRRKRFALRFNLIAAIYNTLII